MVGALLIGGSALPAQAADNFLLKNGSLLGNFDLPLAELPAAVSAQALIADQGTQDLYVLGLIGEGVAGTPPTPVAIRYGRRLGRGDSRIVVGPAPLTLPAMLASGVTLRGGVARSVGGGTLAVGLSSGSALYFYDARTMAPQSIAAFGTQLNLASSGLSTALSKITSVTGLGTKIYATDGVASLVAQIDLMSGAVNSCPVDAAVLGLNADSGKVVATTSKGAATLSDSCTALATSSSTTVGTPSPLSATLPARAFELSERILELTLPRFPAGAKARRGTVVSAAAAPSSTITIGAGTCLNTKFYAGDPAGTPVATNSITLTAAMPRQALFVEQTAPGEDCVAVLTANGNTGEALLRVRGALEGLGANVVLLDRSFSMERSLSGAGAPATPEKARVYAMRQAAAAMLSTVTVISAVVSSYTGMTSVLAANSPWAFLPFTTDVQTSLAAPQTNFSQLPVLGNPDNPGGLRVRGFASATTDNLSPGGPGDLVQAIRSSLPRLQLADQPMYASAGPQRRLWVLTDGSAGSKSYGEFRKLLPSLLRGGVSLHLTGIGGPELDPQLPQLLSLSTRLDGERLFGPAVGQLGLLHTTSAVIENLVTTMSRSLLRGRPVGTIARGALQSGQDLSTTFTLTRDKLNNLSDTWVLLMAAWEDADAAVAITALDGGFPIHENCLRGPNSLICAAVAYDGDYKIKISGSRPGGAPTQAVLRSFVSTALGGGEVGFFPSLVRSINHSGEQVRVQVLLTDRGLPLRGAKITAKLTGPSAAIGTLAAQGMAAPGDIAALIASNGDLTPGQAKAELLSPPTLPTLRPLPTVNFADDSTNGDFEPLDGVYVGQFLAATPGVYVLDLHAEYTTASGNSGTIEDRLVTQVVVGMDKTLLQSTAQATTLSGGIRLRFTPQDASRNLLGPGQAAALSFAQGSKLLTPTVSDYLDGSYRADVVGIDTTQPFDLITPGGRAQVWAPDTVMTTPPAATGCSAAPHATGGPLGLGLGLGLGGLLALRRRRAA